MLGMNLKNELCSVRNPDIITVTKIRATVTVTIHTF